MPIPLLPLLIGAGAFAGTYFGGQKARKGQKYARRSARIGLANLERASQFYRHIFEGGPRGGGIAYDLFKPLESHFDPEYMARVQRRFEGDLTRNLQMQGQLLARNYARRGLPGPGMLDQALAEQAFQAALAGSEFADTLWERERQREDMVRQANLQALHQFLSGMQGLPAASSSIPVFAPTDNFGTSLSKGVLAGALAYKDMMDERRKK